MKKLSLFLAIVLATGAATAASVAQRPGVAARAGATQKVVNTGANIKVAASNTVVDTECQAKFNGCVDTFCITDNIDGGRCQCSAQHRQLATQMAEISAADQKSYQLQTLGVEAIENGTVPTAPTQTNNTTSKRSSRSRVDLSAWDNKPQADDVAKLTGNALYKKAIETCMERIPECEENASFLQTIYSQKIKSDCNAFENAIKQQRTASQTRSAEATRAMRTTAYKKLQEANKYDLGQCTIEYKKCMMTTAGCGEDFKGCVSIVAAEAAQVAGNKKLNAKMYDIAGSETKISIAESSHEILESKRPMCESVLNKCQNVRDQVWATFLREAAPQIKTAELLAENDLRTSCISNISECFRNACKENIDPNDPDGSYDMCLTHPETVRSLCKLQIDPCEATEPLILDYVYARLAAMRVDACTTEVKECLSAEDRCGPDYTACVGLDTNTIIRMCPYDKLVGCQKVYQDTDIRGDAVYDELATMVQGIMLNIDNNLLEFCQNAADEAMIKVCGDTQDCNKMAADEYVGAGSLEYKVCQYKMDSQTQDVNIDYSKCHTTQKSISDVELGRVPGSLSGELGPITPYTALMDGMMFYELISVDDNGNITDADNYFEHATAAAMRKEKKEQIRDEINKLTTSVNNTIELIEADPTVQYCMSGRKVRGMKDASGFGTQVPRFPNLTQQMRGVIANAALKQAKDNYYKKYDALYNQMMQEYADIAERQAEIKGENAKDVRREISRQSCVSLADASALPMSPPPPGGWGAWLVAGIAVVVGTVLVFFTGGASASLVAAGVAIAGSAISSGVATATAVTIAAVTVSAGVGVTAGVTAGAVTQLGMNASDPGNNSQNSMKLELNGHHELSQWNYKQTIDTTFDWNSLNCHKCVKSTKCIKQSYPVFGKPKCKKWADSTTECTDTQL